MERKYDHLRIEQKWQKIWEDRQIIQSGSRPYLNQSITFWICFLILRAQASMLAM